MFAHRHSTGPELIQQVGGRLHGFVAGVGTGGTLMGVAHALRDHGFDTIVAEAIPTATLTAEGDPEVVGGIPGVVAGMSRLLDAVAVGLSEPVLVPDSEAIATAREFGRRGLGIGPSSGLNIAAARRLAASGPGHHVGTILPDRMERYFSTSLFDDVAAELWRLVDGRPGVLAYSTKSEVWSSCSGKTWMKYSTPNISRRIGSGKISDRSGTASDARPPPASCGRRSRRRRCPRSPGIDLIPRRQRPGPEKLGLRPASVERPGFSRRERQAGHVVDGDHVCIAGVPGGDALLSDELAGT